MTPSRRSRWRWEIPARSVFSTKQFKLDDWTEVNSTRHDSRFEPRTELGGAPTGRRKAKKHLQADHFVMVRIHARQPIEVQLLTTNMAESIKSGLELLGNLAAKGRRFPYCSATRASARPAAIPSDYSAQHQKRMSQKIAKARLRTVGPKFSFPSPTPS